MLHIMIIIIVVHEYVCTGIEMTHISNQRWIALFECKIDNIHTKIYQLSKTWEWDCMEYETCWSDAVDNEIDSL